MPRTLGRRRFGAPERITEVATQGFGREPRGGPVTVAGVGAMGRLNAAEVPSALYRCLRKRSEPGLALVAVMRELVAGPRLPHAPPFAPVPT